MKTALDTFFFFFKSLCTDILILLMAMGELTQHGYIHSPLSSQGAAGPERPEWTHSKAHQRKVIVRTLVSSISKAHRQ